MKGAQRISEIAIVIIFIALLRTLGEPLRLNKYDPGELTIQSYLIFTLAALITTSGLFIMILFYRYKKYIAAIVMAVIIITAMLVIKFSFLS